MEILRNDALKLGTVKYSLPFGVISGSCMSYITDHAQTLKKPSTWIPLHLNERQMLQVTVPYTVVACNIKSSNISSAQCITILYLYY